jgi:DNA mismatch repair protein MutL
MTPSPRKIQVLPEHLANKIAAGEVIQRPESVVKELLENSFDAGSTSVTVVVKEGGRKLIQVMDDGTGMDEEDARMSFLRHATSKIATYEDLEVIRTYGFRGEALASIAAVAHVILTTRRAEDDVAVEIRIDGGGEVRATGVARERGTTVAVQNLFYNVPARRKFLKSPNTEFRHVHDVVVRAALSRPDIGMDFVSDDEPVLQLAAGPLDKRVTDLFGERQFEGLLPVDETTDLLRIHGFIGKPSFGQRSRSTQYLFLNGRTILNRNITHAVYSAYEHLLAGGTYPFFVLFLETDPRQVDVNIHPSKMEAKFEDEQGIYRMVSSVARKALAGGMSVPSLTGTGHSDNLGLAFTTRQHSWPREQPVVDIRTGEILPLFGPEGTFTRGPGTLPPVTPVFPESGFAGSIQEAPAGSLLWQLHNRYILSQIKSGLMIVDQHVAHERILYEQALERMNSSGRSSQQLLFPSTQQLPADDYNLLEELLPEMDLLGFDVKVFGRGTVVVEGMPPEVRPGSEGRILAEILDLYKEYRQDSPTQVRDNLAKSYACRSAIKSGDPLGEQEMRSLIDQLFATKMPYVCPHGRPIVLRISLEEFDRRFGRR